MTAMVSDFSVGSIIDRSGGLRAGSSPISFRWVTGRGPVVGEEPVQRTSMLLETVA